MLLGVKARAERGVRRLRAATAASIREGT